MQHEFARHLESLHAAGEPFAVATVIRVHGSASARPGSKALIDAQGRNVFGWVGGGCAESLVREESLQALRDGQTRIVNVDLDDEVLGVGMPCGGKMDVYIEPQLPPRLLTIAGHGRLAQHIAALASLQGYSVSVYAPQATAEQFPTATQVTPGAWSQFSVPPGGLVVVSSEHAEHLPAVRQALRGQPGYLGLVASRRVSQVLRQRLRAEGITDETLSQIHTPAGLDLGCQTLEEISLSILAELLAHDRRRSAYPLRTVKGVLPQPAAAPRGAESGPGELLVLGHGRIAEELARLGALLRWPVTVNSPAAQEGDFPQQTCLIQNDLDYSQLNITPRTYVVIATLHKGDHLSMQRALEGQARYIGLVASQRRSGLVVDYLRERGIAPERMANVHAPAGLDLGAANPREIALSILSEIVAVRHGGCCRPLREVESSAGAVPKDCLHQSP